MRDSLSIPGLVAVVGIAGCTYAPEAVVKERASAELSCPGRELQVTCSGGKVFHMHDQFDCDARGCGKLGRYRCEAPLLKRGPLEMHGDATCW
jgi:hypothetical protein